MNNSVIFYFLISGFFVLSTFAAAEDVRNDYQVHCLACHGGVQNGDVTNGPQLGGLSAKYIHSQLKNFKDGRRGSGGVEAKIMSDALAIYDEEDFFEIAHWASHIKSERRFDYSRFRNTEGYKLYEKKCKGCHNGMGRLITGSPKLSNLDSGYLIRQLHFIGEDLRKYDKPTKHQLKMQAVVKDLTDDEFDLLARFITAATEPKEETSK